VCCCKEEASSKFGGVSKPCIQSEPGTPVSLLGNCADSDPFLGIILDMIEYLRTDSKNVPTDQDLALWLEKNYICPFARIGRLDGLVVRDALETTILVHAHGRYSKVFPMPEGSRLPPQRLWVPGLEPTEVPQVREDVISSIEGIAPREPLETYEMYKTFDMQTGKSLGMWKDLMGWTREIRETPKPKIVSSKHIVPGKLLVKRLVANEGVSERRTPEIRIFSNRTDRRRKLNDRSKLTVRQRKLSETFANATLARQAGSLSSPLDTPATLIDAARLVVPFQLSWKSPLDGEDGRQPIASSDRKRVGIIEGRLGGELKIRKEALPSTSSTGASTDNDAALSISFNEESVNEAASDSGAEGVDESEDDQNNDGTRGFGADNESESIDRESEESMGTDSESESVSIRSESDGGDEDSEYSDAMDLSE
jgi:hypothetical protein